MSAHPHVTGTLADAAASARARVAAARAARAADAAPSRVAAGLYVGGAAAARDARALAAARVTHVVNAAPSLPNWFDKKQGGGGGPRRRRLTDQEEEGGDGGAAPSLALAYLNVPVFDDARDDLGAAFPSVVAFIDAAHATGGTVLVHCVAGASRSVTLAAAWLVARRGATADAALAAVAAARPVARPNPGFVRQLAAWAACGAAAAPPPPAVLAAAAGAAARSPPPRAASAADVRPRSAPLPSSKSAAALASLPASDRPAALVEEGEASDA